MKGAAGPVHPPRRPRPPGALAVASVVAAFVLGLSGDRPAGAQVAEDAGEAIMVAGAGSSKRLAAGGSATEFSLRLPQGSSCPGDSADGNYRVQSYMVPDSIAPADVQYDGLGPKPNAYGDWATFRQPLYDTATNPFDTAQTANATKPGLPGRIVNIPTFTFDVYRPGELPAGRYHIGIACTLFNRPVRYWDTKLVLTRSPDDEPARISWALATRTGVADASSSSGPAVVGVLVGAVATAGVYVRKRRRPSRRLPGAREAR